ncbi:DUF3662 domain-containing protein [Amnibacterium sp. CER49]|uniref:FhaA domain-containing protein n=1 Tax=Amnibacterium sp. CER49 TaxID=3039161 RepID=UPI00244D17A4|nr:FhaA domain-containing protein [Amnibacterium sp. CER49]MDH2442988.1 DUF3662 domain-containing protein [Amnibacterium sp. CER49]
MWWGSAVLGFLVGVVLAGLVAFGLARTLMRITTVRDLRGLARLVLTGLLPGTRRDGVIVQRALARLLKDTYSVMASGRRVAATAIDVHVSPEDYRLITSSIGTDAAVADLVEFYIGYARENQWRLATDPLITIRRDISLRPRQAYAQRTLHPADEPDEAEITAELNASRLELPPEPPIAQPTEVLPNRTETPLERTEETAPGEPYPTRAYEASDTEVLGVGDLVVVHGTDVRTVPRERGRALVGRADSADIRIDRPGVSREHVELELREDGWWAVPRSAKNGTLLDGRLLQGPARLPVEATLGLGRGVRLQLTVEPVGLR